MKTYALFLLFLFVYGSGQSQEISGRLLNAASAEPVPNAQIKVLQDAQKTFSAADGFFSLKVDQLPVTLEINALGFADQNVVVEDPAETLRILLQPEVESLSEVILQGTVIPASLLKTPAAVSVLTSGDLERYQSTNVLQAMNSVPGVYIHQGALNTNKMSIRGIGARSQYSTNRVKAYFEGIPISSAEGATTLDDIDQDVVERIEIIKGPTSSVYGAGLGGVINLYAKEADLNENRATAETTFGSFGLLKKTLKTSLASEAASVFAAYNHLKSDSFRENGEYDRKSITVHAEISAAASGKVSLLGNFTRLMAYIPSSLNEQQFKSEPSAAAYTWGASRGYESYDKGMLGLSYQVQLSESLTNTSSIYMNFRDAFEPRPFDILKEEQGAAGARTKFNLEEEVFGRPSEFSFGAEYYREWYDTATFANLYEEQPREGSILGAGLSNNSQNRSYVNFFGQWNLSLSERFKVEAGLNINSTSYELTDLFYGDDINQSGDYTFDTQISPRLGAVYTLAEGKTLYASISHGFSTPAVAETLTPEGLINTALQPATGINYEIGHKGNWLDNRLYAEIALFSIQLENLIVAERVGQDQYIGRNAGKTDHNGVEVFLTYNAQLTPGLRLKPYLNASLNFYEFDEFTDDGIDHSGNSLPGVPDKTINAGFDLRSRTGFAFNAGFQHIGENPLNDENTRFNGSYNLVHLKSSYEFSLLKVLEVEISAGVNNLFDEHYASSILPNAVGFGGAAPRYYYPGEPQNFYGGLAVSYIF